MAMELIAPLPMLLFTPLVPMAIASVALSATVAPLPIALEPVAPVPTIAPSPMAVADSALA
jgi:hypothetical protein